MDINIIPTDTYRRRNRQFFLLPTFIAAIVTILMIAVMAIMTISSLLFYIFLLPAMVLGAGTLFFCHNAYKNDWAEDYELIYELIVPEELVENPEELVENEPVFSDVPVNDVILQDVPGEQFGVDGIASFTRSQSSDLINASPLFFRDSPLSSEITSDNSKIEFHSQSPSMG